MCVTGTISNVVSPICVCILRAMSAYIDREQDSAWSFAFNSLMLFFYLREGFSKIIYLEYALFLNVFACQNYNVFK